MSKFKIIVVRPLTDFDTLGLQVANIKEWDLTKKNITPQQIQDILQIAAREVEKAGGIMATSMGGGRFVNTSFKASANKRMFINFPEPNPICIYYKSANDHLDKSLPFRDQVLNMDGFPSAQQKFDAFVDYFQETSEGVTLLSKTIEGFLNQQIPDDTELEIDGKKGKARLEWLPIGTKLRELMIQLKDIDFYKTNQIEYYKITEMIALRDDLVHLKTTVKSNFTVYQELFKRLVDFDHVGCSNSVFTFVNKIAPGYFVEKGNDAHQIAKLE
ncbi:hypothetical protein FEM33_11360 [Dyadobacter flavalbus]|uniref:Uncharacterized protein n=1 Tax=Dyadobacter flavalbus TaxID=2579942 RepID=A0A5M8QY89_9BACT|nr:hypothetical protein [Dyadobacter flavalbus]KAA6439694.1 hypothetical protein FEM33_11360 [Dyadobacter flavalbus]